MVLNCPGIVDLVEGIKRWRVALYIAWSDTRARYRRSVLGPLWLTLGTAVGVVGLGLLWSELLKIERATFLPSLTAGLIIWQLLAGCITESTTAFIRQSHVIRNLKMPYFIHPLQLLLRQLVNFAHNIFVYMAVAIIFSVPLTSSTLLVVPGLVLLSLNLLWMALFLGMLGARFRDVEYAVGALIPLLFFISPVIYRPDYLPFSAKLIWLNPLSHLIEVVRSPLLGITPPPFVYITVCDLLVVGWVLTLWIFNRRYQQIAFLV